VRRSTGTSLQKIILKAPSLGLACSMQGMGLGIGFILLTTSF